MVRQKEEDTEPCAWKTHVIDLKGRQGDLHYGVHIFLNTPDIQGNENVRIWEGELGTGDGKQLCFFITVTLDLNFYLIDEFVLFHLKAR